MSSRRVDLDLERRPVSDWSRPGPQGPDRRGIPRHQATADQQRHRQERTHRQGNLIMVTSAPPRRGQDLQRHPSLAMSFAAGAGPHGDAGGRRRGAPSVFQDARRNSNRGPGCSTCSKVGSRCRTSCGPTSRSSPCCPAARRIPCHRAAGQRRDEWPPGHGHAVRRSDHHLRFTPIAADDRVSYWPRTWVRSSWWCMPTARASG